MPPASPLDRPDTYSGIWNMLRVTHIYPDTAQGVYHLGLRDQAAGTYCTRLNPVHRYALQGLKLPTDGGGYCIPDRSGVIVGHIISGHIIRPRFQGNQLDWCPDCLTMAAVQAEMIGQNIYTVQGLLNAMRGIQVPHT